jgi:hypothetical protein
MGLNDITEESLDNGDEYLFTPENMYGSEGVLYIAIEDVDSLRLVNQYAEELGVKTVYKVIKEAGEEGLRLSEPLTLPSGCVIVGDTIDQNSPHNYASLVIFLKQEGIMTEEVASTPKNGGRFIRLECTTGRSNKYYEMIVDNPLSSHFKTAHGAMYIFGSEKTRTESTYPVSEWQKKYDEKIRKGYVVVKDEET